MLRLKWHTLSLRSLPLLSVSVALSAALLTACPSDEPGPEPEPQPDVVEPEPQPDGGITEPDAGPEPTDAGVPPTDAGSADGGVVVPPTDGGMTPTDAGTPPADAGVDAGPPPVEMNACLVAEDGQMQVAQQARLRWKRVDTLENDLRGIFDLTAELACGEVGIQGICFDAIHQVPLGGYEPVSTGMTAGIATTSKTTPLSLERVAVATCGARVDLDTVRQRNTLAKQFWTHIDLDATELDPDDINVRAQLTDLVKHVLGRLPTDAELDHLASLATPLDNVAVPARDFAKTACFAVVTQTEFLFQ